MTRYPLFARILRALVAAVGLLVAVPCLALEVPRLERRVTDDAGIFSSKAVTEMEAELELLENDTGAQVAILTIPSLQGQPLEDFSMRVAEAWQLGQKERDNGALVLIARDDRKIRIEVGYGLEGVLPDALCGRIIDNAMRPAFREGDFSGGTQRAVEVIAGLIRGDPEASQNLDSRSDRVGEIGGMLVTLVVFLAVIGTFVVNALFSKGGGAWFLYIFLAPFFFVFPAAVFGYRVGVIMLLVWLAGFPILRILIWHTGAGKSFRTSHPSWIPRSSSGGSRRGGGSSFGGFSGGGGSFGGGGASGGW